MPRGRLLTLLIVLGLLALPLGLLWQQTIGGKTLLPADTLFEFQPWKAAASSFGLGPYSQNHLPKDLILENYAWKRFIVESIQQRQLPLWNPYTFSGEPFLANGQHSMLYPFSVIFYILPLWQAYGWFTVSQLWLAGIGMYLLCRVLGQRRASAVIAAIAYQLSAFFVVSVAFPMVIAAAAWLPFVLAMTELLMSQRTIRGQPARAPWAMLGALGLGVMMLAGHAEMIYPYALFVVGTFALWRLLIAHVMPSTLHAILWFCVMVGLGLGLGAVQFVPMLEMARLNFREGSASFADVLSWAYPWRRMIAFFIPNFFGNESHHFYTDVFTGKVAPVVLNAFGQVSQRCPYCTWWDVKNSVEGGAYLGILTLFLALLNFKFQISNFRLTADSQSWISGFQHLISNLQSLISKLRSEALNLKLYFALLALFSLGCIFPTRLYAVIYVLPGLGQLHSPFRWVFPLTLAAAVLAGFGADVLAQTRESTLHNAQCAIRNTSRVLRVFFLDSRPSFITFLAAIAFWSGVIVVAGLLLSRYVFPAQSVALADRAVHQLALADQTFADGRMFYSYQFRWVLLFGLMLMSAGIVLRVSRCPIYLPKWLGQRPVWELLAVIVLALDLMAYGYGFNPAVDPKLLDYTPPVVEFLKQDTSLWRLTTYDPRGLKTFDKNVGWFYDFQDVRGYDSMFPKQYAQYMSVIDQQDELAYNRIAPVRQQAALDSPMLDLLNVKYVLTEDPIPNTKFTQVYSDTAIRVYRNDAVAPRAFTLPQPCTVVADDPFDALRRNDPRTTVIIEPPISSLQSPIPDTHSALCTLQSANITVYASNEVWIDVNVKEPSWLILADSYFPGWLAYVRPWSTGEEAEQPLDIVRADGNFRAVRLAPGAWTVRFKYSPNSVKFGAFASFVAGMSLVFILAVWVWRRFYRESEQDSPARRVAKNSFTSIGLTLMTRAIDLAFAMLMARVLGPDGAGKYYYAALLFTTFDIFTSFGLHTLLTREVSKDREQTGRYLVNTTALRLMLGAAGVPVLILFILIRQLAASPQLAPDTIWTIGLLYLGLAPSSLSTGLTGLFYAYEKAEVPAAISVVTVLVKVCIGVPVLLAGGGIVGLAATSIVVNLVTLIILTVLAMRMITPSLTLPRTPFPTPLWGVGGVPGKAGEGKGGGLDSSLLRSMLRQAFPLMLNNLLATLFFKVDVLLLEPMQGDKVVGWYSQAYKVLDMLNIIPSYFTMALFPVLSRQAGEDKEAARRSYLIAVKLLVMIALPCAVAFTFLAYAAVSLLGGPRFLPDGAIALQLMIWSIPIGWINSVTNYTMIALGLQRKLTVAFIAGLTFNITANLIFIPLYSYRAAAVVTIFSEMVEGLAFYYYLRKDIGAVPWVRLVWRSFAAAGVMAGAMAMLWPVNAIAALLIGCAAYPVALLALGAIGAEERAVLARIAQRA